MGLWISVDSYFPSILKNTSTWLWKFLKSVAWCLITMHNMKKILESEKELSYLSYHDSMTELYNRTYINQILFDSVEDNKTCVLCLILTS